MYFIYSNMPFVCFVFVFFPGSYCGNFKASFPTVTCNDVAMVTTDPQIITTQLWSRRGSTNIRLHCGAGLCQNNKATSVTHSLQELVPSLKTSGPSSLLLGTHGHWGADMLLGCVSVLMFTELILMCYYYSPRVTKHLCAICSSLSEAIRSYLGGIREVIWLFVVNNLPD